MITKKRFSEIDTEVQNSVNETFDFIKGNSREDRYILLLASGEYDDISYPIGSGYNPHSIENRGDHYNDESRFKFFIQFLKAFYSFPKGVGNVPDDEFRITLELMIYTHIWESKNLLKQLYRLSQLVLDKSYPWKVVVPEMGKQNFIRIEIRDKFRTKGLTISEIITKGFHTSLRNAFAHSEYSLNGYTKNIVLRTYKGDSTWDIPSISYDAWSERFVYSALLSFYLIKLKQDRRNDIIKEFKKDEFVISHPIDEKTTKYRKIYCNHEYDVFRFLK